MDSDAVTIIVPTINHRPDLLARCTAEVERTMRTGDRLIVAEGGTFAENCNAGAAEATTPYVILLNDDTKVDQDDWIDRLCDPFTDPTVGVVGCRLIYPDGKLQHTGIFFDMPNGVLTAINRTWDVDSGGVSAVTGACLAIRTDLFRDLGGFDEGYRNGLEDVDLCLRARMKGYTVWYENGCTVIHHESSSGPRRWEFVRENIQRFAEMWHVREEGGDTAPADGAVLGEG